MEISLVMTIIGPDRPAIVESLAAAVTDSGGNWLASRMMHLGGQFAGILQVTLPTAREAEFRQRLPKFEQAGLKIVLYSDTPASPAAAPRTIRLSLVGQDRPGIVRQISHALAEAGANVEELETECSSAPMSGETLFHAKAQATLPAGSDLAKLRQSLERVAADLMVELTVET